MKLSLLMTKVGGPWWPKTCMYDTIPCAEQWMQSQHLVFGFGSLSTVSAAEMISHIMRPQNLAVTYTGDGSGADTIPHCQYPPAWTLTQPRVRGTTRYQTQTATGCHWMATSPWITNQSRHSCMVPNLGPVLRLRLTLAQLFFENTFGCKRIWNGVFCRDDKNVSISHILAWKHVIRSRRQAEINLVFWLLH